MIEKLENRREKLVDLFEISIFATLPLEEMDRLIEKGEKKSEIARQLKISRETLYRYLRLRKAKDDRGKILT